MIGNPSVNSPLDFPPLQTVHERFHSHGFPSFTNRHSNQQRASCCSTVIASVPANFLSLFSLSSCCLFCNVPHTARHSCPGIAPQRIDLAVQELNCCTHPFIGHRVLRRWSYTIRYAGIQLWCINHNTRKLPVLYIRKVGKARKKRRFPRLWKLTF